MSFYDDASLVFLAGGAAGKVAKIYSLKPTDGSGDLTLNRGANMAATRVGKDGYIEKGRENLLLQSNQFDITPWGNSNTTNTTSQIGYDGTSDALLATVSGGAQIIGQNVSGSGVQTVSLYAKGSVNNGLRIFAFGDNNVDFWFNLNTGLVDGAVSSKVLAYNIENAGNGWYRCSFTFTQNTTSIYFYITDNNRSNASSGSIYIQDAQLEQGLVATDYIETGATTATAGLLEDEPRFDYNGGGCPALLLEPTRTNYLKLSEYFADSSWTKLNVDADASNIASPEGKSNSYKITETTANDYHAINVASADRPTLSAGSHTHSCFVKANGVNDIVFYNNGTSGAAGVDFDLSAESYSNLVNNATAASIESYGNGWYRISMTFTASAGTTSPTIYLRTLSAYAGDGVSGIYMYGMQTEAGSNATSYIPNYGAAATITRSTDSITQITAPDVNTDAYTFFVHDSHDLETSNRGCRMKGTSPSLALMGYYTNAGDKYFFCYTDDGSPTPAFVNYNAGALTEAKYAYVIDNTNNTAKLFLNGSFVKSGTLSVAVTADTITFGAGVGSPNRIPQVIYFPTALSNNDAEILTGATSYRSFNVMTSALNYTIYE